MQGQGEACWCVDVRGVGLQERAHKVSARQSLPFLLMLLLSMSCMFLLKLPVLCSGNGVIHLDAGYSCSNAMGGLVPCLCYSISGFHA